MKDALYLVIVVILAIGVVLLLWRGRKKVDGPWPFLARKVLSPPEQVLFFRLQRALPERIVLAQVQMSRMLGVRQGNSFQYWFNKINRLSLDYVVCLKDSTIVVAIELDDSSHSNATRREADERKAKALQAAGIPLVRWQASALPDDTSIRNAIAGTGQHGTPKP